jgi:DNA polymerase-3 subunit beta
VEIARQVKRDVDLALDDASGEVQARCGKSEWTLPRLPVEDFPTSAAAPPQVAEVEARAFRGAVARVLPAAGSDPAVPSLCAVRLEPSPNGGLTLVATNRFRLHVAQLPIESGEAPEAMVPPDLLAAAARHGDDGSLALACRRGTFGVASDDFRLTGRQVDAQFPRWQPLIPERSEHRAVLEVAELSRVVDHVQVMAGQGDDDAVELRFDGDTVEATAFVTDADRRARAEGACDVRGEPMTVTLRPLYLRDALAALPADHASVQVVGAKCLLLPCTADGAVVDGTTTLVMGRKPRAR